MWASFGRLSVVPWILFAQSSWNMDAVPIITAAQPPSEVTLEVRDHAEMFDRGAELRAWEVLQRVDREHRIPVQIETIKSLDEAWIADIAQQRARMAGADELYILVAKTEQEVGVIGARRGPASRLTDQQRESIRRAFLAPLQAGEADEALERGVRAIGTTLDSAASGPKSSIREGLVVVAILMVIVAALLTSRTREWYEDRGRRHLRAAGAITRGHVNDPSSSSPGASRILRAAHHTTDMREPLRTARMMARCREQVEA